MSLTQVNNLITTHTFKDKEYIIKLKIISNNMELNITEKQIGEEWQGSYDQTYIENLTTRTGNFKSFDVFSRMLKSGLLKTSRSIKLDLITFEDLHHLRAKHVYSKLPNINASLENRRYLIISYNVEFDKIIYPLIMEYCGPPDVNSLIAIIRRLESELKTAKDTHPSNKLENNVITCKNHGTTQKRIKELTMENMKLVEEVRQLRLKTSINATKVNAQHSKQMASGLSKLQKSILDERKAHNNLVDKLKQEKAKMQKEIDTMRRNECSLKQQLVQSRKSSGISSLSDKRSNTSKKSNSIRGSQSSPLPNKKKVVKRSSSKSTKASSASNSSSRTCNSSSKANSSRLENGDSSYSSQSHTSSHTQSDKCKMRLKQSEREYKELEQRLDEFQKMFKSKLK